MEEIQKLIDKFRKTMIEKCNTCKRKEGVSRIGSHCQECIRNLKYPVKIKDHYINEI